MRFLDIYDDCLLDKTDFYENVLETLEKLKKMNFTLAICSNKPELLVKRIVKGLNAMHYFDAITGGDTYEFRKPDSRHLERTILEAEKKVDQAIMVGDSENDIKCANSINVPSIVVDFGYSRAPVENLNANIIMNNYQNLIMHIEEINNN